MEKTYKLIVLGCQMNKSDAERIEAVLQSLGYIEAKTENEANILMIVACSVRQKGIDRIYGKARLWQKHKKKGEVITMLTGCLALHDKKKMEKKFDFIFDIKNLWELEKFLFEKETLPKDYLKITPKYQSKAQAFVPIMTGCNNFCSYCIVPYVRGREVSIDFKDILAQAEDLVKAGCKEITLLGQNVNSYDPKDSTEFSTNNPYKDNFPKLLWELNQIEGLERIHFMTSHPKDMSDDLIDALALPKQMNYLHLPVQSGSDKVLKAMNRKYSVRDYLKIIEKVKKVKPDIAIGTDIIVGYPGETEKDFQASVDLYNKVKFDICYISQFSPRPQTEAEKLEDNVSKAEKKKRWQKLQELNEKYSFENNKKYLGKKVSVLIDKSSFAKASEDRVDEDIWEGNSLEMKRVRVKSDKELLGEIVEVEVKERKEWILFGNTKLEIMKKRKVIIVSGPTGSGKSDIALEIAKEFDGFLIAADSRQVYKYMDIGTNKDRGEWEDKGYFVDGILEYGVDFIDPKEDFTVADWLEEVERVINENPDKLPIIVGGTGLYISALTQGFKLAPEVSKKLRLKLNKKLEKKGPEYLVQKLLKLDPEAKDFIDLKNPRRVIRALEVIKSTKQKFSEFQEKSVSDNYQFLQMGVEVDREVLYEKINKRVDEMMQEGLVDEIKRLNENGYTCDLPIMKNTIGYQEVCEFVLGRAGLDEAKENLKQNTRHYAKRQITWFLRDKSIKWVKGYNDAKPFIQAFLGQ